MFYTVDLAKDGSRLNKYISNTLLTKITENLNSGKKSLVYLNRRGTYNLLCCSDCSHIYKCKNCDVSLKIHEKEGLLVCHICGFSKNIPLNCEKCKSVNLQKLGVGTEQIESSLKKYYPDVKIYRFDADTVKTSKQKNQALLELQNAQIVIGTKMMTTGFDFENVSLIGIILLEQELNSMSYNIEEITYDNLKQLIGRGGRKGEKKEIILQTFAVGNDFVKLISEGNYKEFLTKTLTERKIFSYPPYKDYAILEYYDKNEQKSFEFLQIIQRKLESFDQEKKIDYFLSKKGFKKTGFFHHKLILRGENLRETLENIRFEIIKNPRLNINFG